MKPHLSISLEDVPAADTDFVQQQLMRFNQEHVQTDNHQTLTVLLRDEKQRIVAGLLGSTYWGWLVIEILWVAEELRGQGYGSRLLATAEAEALKRGCKHAHLSTMSFQAPEFYSKHGYRIFGKLENLPQGHSRIYMKKDFAPN